MGERPFTICCKMQVHVHKRAYIDIPISANLPFFHWQRTPSQLKLPCWDDNLSCDVPVSSTYTMSFIWPHQGLNRMFLALCCHHSAIKQMQPGLWGVTSCDQHFQASSLQSVLWRHTMCKPATLLPDIIRLLGFCWNRIISLCNSKMLIYPMAQCWWNSNFSLSETSNKVSPTIFNFFFSF